MTDLSDKDSWYLKGTSKAIAYEYLKEYDLSDEMADGLYRYICSYLIVSLFDYFKIVEDPFDYANMLYHGEKAMLGFIGTVDPDILEDKSFKLELLTKDRERVIEDRYLYTLVRSKAEKFDYELFDDLISETFMYLITDKEYTLQMAKESSEISE
ncbi:MAG: hypothetical protein IJ115_01305 [Erysipelotrichaceae bacterium]|nr:hypothetical protein [Erysipelotrichaceae bacterium]